MALVKCKECGKDVSKSAKVCPWCAVKNPGLKAGDAFKGFALILFIGFVISKCSSDDEPVKNNSSPQAYDQKEDKKWPSAISSLVVYAKPYSIIEAEDYSFAGRKRMKWFISSPEANSYETYLGTAIQAAKDLAQTNRVNQANVIIEPSSNLAGLGYNLAIVTFTVDGKGNAGDSFDGEYWNAEAARLPPDPLRVKVAEVWYENRNNFQNSNGLTDEPKIIKFISTKLKIPESEVNMPWVDKVKLVF